MSKESSTIMVKTVYCERYDMNIDLRAKYFPTGNPDNPFEARFGYATCPIAENRKIPAYKQAEEYKYLKCYHEYQCNLLHDFKEIVDARTNNC